jgi:arsenite methyltransferase
VASQRHGSYGVDAPFVLLGLGAGVAVWVALAIVAALLGGPAAVWFPLLGVLIMTASFLLFLHTTRRGKFVAWDDALDALGLRGDEQVLDLGCGRGAVLLAVARRLSTGRAFDVVVSSMAIHNIPSDDGRGTAIDEALRVLRPGGRLVIADISAVADYRQRLVERGAVQVSVRPIGWRMWWGGPWLSTRWVTASAPRSLDN